MNLVRIIYDDTADFVPIPEALRHRKIEIILWPLDDQAAPIPETLRPDSGQRRPGAWSHLPPAAADWDSPEVNQEIARSLSTAIAEQCTFLTRDGPILDLGLTFVERG